MAELGTGTTITFSTGFCAEILSISGPGLSREMIDISHMGTTTAHAYMVADLYDAGELTVELQFVPGTAIPIAGAFETVTITFPDSGASTLAFSGAMSGFEPSIPLEDKMTATATIKATGAITQG